MDRDSSLIIAGAPLLIIGMFRYVVTCVLLPSAVRRKRIRRNSIRVANISYCAISGILVGCIWRGSILDPSCYRIGNVEIAVTTGVVFVKTQPGLYPLRGHISTTEISGTTTDCITYLQSHIHHNVTTSDYLGLRAPFFSGRRTVMSGLCSYAEVPIWLIVVILAVSDVVMYVIKRQLLFSRVKCVICHSNVVWCAYPECHCCAAPIGSNQWEKLKRAQSNGLPFQCRHCSYNLRGNQTGICPECGQAIIDEQYEWIQRESAMIL